MFTEGINLRKSDMESTSGETHASRQQHSLYKDACKLRREFEDPRLYNGRLTR
jgi:hypothetical protein